jgi:ABC-type bacteriocin/lantibiotic exporter with double-glycine peptidase domain
MANITTNNQSQYISLKHLTLKHIFLEYKFKIIFTLLLVILENVLYLFFPLVLGFAINGLIEDNLFWLWTLLALGLGDMLVSALRRFYDTRVYGKIYIDLSPKLVENEFKKTTKVSKVSARLDMLEELIDFFEETLPSILGTIISLGGTLSILYFLNLDVFTLALIVMFLVMGIYRITKNKTSSMHTALNNTKESQVEVLKHNSKRKTKNFSKKLMKCYIKLSDLEMVNYAVSFTLLISLICGSLYLIVQSGLKDYGAIFSIVIYLFNFLEDVTDLPAFYQNYIRLTEIMGRLK